MDRSHSSGNLESSLPLSDEQLHQLILKAYDEAPDIEQLQMPIRDIMLGDPERIRLAYRKVVQLKARSRATSEIKSRPQQSNPPVTLALVVPGAGGGGGGSRSSKRASRSRNHLSAVMDASGLRETGRLDSLKVEMAALCRVQHQNLLNLVAFSHIKGARFSLDFDLVNTSHVTLLDMFQEEEEAGNRSLNGCEVACVLAQTCLGMIFLLDRAIPVLDPVVVNPAACLLTENIILTDRGLIKLGGHHPTLRLPRRRPPPGQQISASPLASPDDGDPERRRDSESSSTDLSAWADRRPGYLAHRVAMLLYELDHPLHQPLLSLRHCTQAERSQLDQRYTSLFSLCTEWPPDRPVDMRCVLYSDFINEQTCAIKSYQSPLEIIFESRSRRSPS